MSEITSAKPVICDRCGEAIDFRCFPAAIHVVGEKNFHIGCVTSKPDLRDDRIAELEKGFSMDSAPLDGTAILLQSETGSLNIGWRSGDAWSYGGGKWEDRLVVRWWPLPRTFREARTTLEASEKK